MDRKRAKKIAVSSEMANVMYNGEPVYIEQINQNTERVSIHYLNQPENSLEVHLTQLVES